VEDAVVAGIVTVPEGVKVVFVGEVDGADVLVVVGLLHDPVNCGM
jgi:hypothetical protein